MLRELSVSAFNAWAAFYAAEPWGFHLHNYAAGTVAAAANAPRGYRRVMAPGDFMYAYQPPRTPAQDIALLRTIPGMIYAAEPQ